ncbi:ATP synthase F1 subunit delta [Geofilum rubicundum]|uniref:ATP synthase subunit delta n=1 Tax=Geofilum rubicundum JCM 15548 TaxID=1236989 RepID=A0A0E9LT05_9BACT|nr:ATP synthase F1 subunit delta [Geofilum rubicundum]GAO28291.1 ATP synthase delta chain [Geofilum rubicundum JCM 15548]
MNASLITVRYASALFQLGKEEELLLDRLYADCSFLLASTRESKELTQFLENPIVKPGVKKKALENVFKDHLDDHTLRFLNIIIDNNRESLLANALVDFIDMYRDYKGIKSVTVVTAVPVDEVFKQQIRQVIESHFSCKVELECKENPDILGGLILMMDGKQVDGSVIGQLRALKKKMMIN